MWAADTDLAADTDVSSEGYFVLRWTTGADTGSPVLLQQADTENFSSPIEYTLDANGSITLTGLENGRYYFRARQADSPFSDTVIVDVAHHSLARAFAFFLVGLVLFMILVVTIIRGNRELVTARGEESTDAR